MEKTPLIITVLILIVGSVFFFASGAYKGMANPLAEAKFKAAYTPTGDVKLFVFAPAEELGKLDAEGSSIPRNTIVIGSAEAAMMREEGLFSAPGDPIIGLFGINTSVGGVLRPTNSSIDDMHFLDEEQFASIEGEERVYVKFNEGMPKLFYRKGVDESTSLSLALAEGDITQYRPAVKEGKTYQPVLIGATEAGMMREEKLFSAPGDTIDGFFGQDVIIVGVLKQTNTSLDMMHIVPFSAEELT